MIKNYNLELFLSNYFGKNIKEITKEELENIEMISLDGLNIEGFYEKIDFNEIINLFKNLKKLVVNNYVFTADDIKLIDTKNIIEYSFYKCDFKSINEKELFKHSQILMFERCAFKNYDFLKNNYENLEVLCVSNPSDEEEIDIDLLNAPKLKEVYLERCIVNNFSKMTKYNELEFLNILGSEIKKEELLEFKNLKSLNLLFVSEEYVDDEIIKILINHKINIKYNVNELLFESEEV